MRTARRHRHAEYVQPREFGKILRFVRRQHSDDGGGDFAVKHAIDVIFLLPPTSVTDFDAAAERAAVIAASVTAKVPAITTGSSPRSARLLMLGAVSKIMTDGSAVDLDALGGLSAATA